jgi:hypothetical protein
LRQKLEEAGIEVLPSEHPTREVFTEDSLRSMGIKVLPARGDGFIIGIGKVQTNKPTKD